MLAALRALLPALLRMPDWFKVLVVMAIMFVMANQATSLVSDLRAITTKLQGECDAHATRLTTLEGKVAVQEGEIRLLREDIRRMEGKVDILLQKIR